MSQILEKAYRDFTTISNPQFRANILHSYFGVDVSEIDIKKRPEIGEAYFPFYQEQCETADLTEASHLTTHQDLIDVLTELKSPLATRETVRDAIKQTPAWINERKDAVFNEIIDLVLRLWLMLLVGSFRHVITPGQGIVSWNDGDGSLPSMAVSLFAPNHAHKHVIMLDKKFNAFNIERKAGIKIIWTNNLEDHLCLKDEDTRLAIFHHASISGMACSSERVSIIVIYRP